MPNETKILYIDCDIDFMDTLNEWKKLCNERFGHGGQKTRIQKIIKDDLELMKGGMQR
jgi:lipopolysaccharide biosynthesis glycosyltransferase